MFMEMLYATWFIMNFVTSPWKYPANDYFVAKCGQSVKASVCGRGDGRVSGRVRLCFVVSCDHSLSTSLNVVLCETRQTVLSAAVQP